jgi:hypothetical protein
MRAALSVDTGDPFFARGNILVGNEALNADLVQRFLQVVGQVSVWMGMAYETFQALHHHRGPLSHSVLGLASAADA